MYDFAIHPFGTIASRFRAERERAGISQVRVAAECCVPPEQVEAWERQGGMPAEALQLCAALGMSPMFIVTGARHHADEQLAADVQGRTARQAVFEGLIERGAKPGDAWRIAEGIRVGL